MTAEDEDDPALNQARREYRDLLVAIGEYYHTKWRPVDRLLTSFAGSLVVGLVVLVLSGGEGFVRILGDIITGASAGGMAATAFLHSRRTRVMLLMHQRAISLMERELPTVTDVVDELGKRRRER